MPEIDEQEFYDGAEAKIERLGLGPLLDEVRSAATGFTLRIKKEKNKNSAGVLREMIDQGFREVGGWKKAVSGDIDWQKCKTVNGTQVCIGVEVQVSARSDLIFRDVVHFRNNMIKGAIDLAVLIVPSDATAYYLTDRTPSMSDGRRIIGTEMAANDLPLVLISIKHDGWSNVALKKKRTNLGRIRKPG